MKRKLLKLYVNNFPSGFLIRVKARNSIRRDSTGEIKRNWMFEGNRTDFNQGILAR